MEIQSKMENTHPAASSVLSMSSWNGLKKKKVFLFVFLTNIDDDDLFRIHCSNQDKGTWELSPRNTTDSFQT